MGAGCAGGERGEICVSFEVQNWKKDNYTLHVLLTSEKQAAELQMQDK